MYPRTLDRPCEVGAEQCAPVERANAPNGLNAERRDEVRSGVSRRHGHVAVETQGTQVHGHGRLLRDSSREVDFFQEVSGQSPHLPNVPQASQSPCKSESLTCSVASAFVSIDTFGEQVDSKIGACFCHF